MESYRNERIELLKSLRWGEWYGNPFKDMKTALAEFVIILNSNSSLFIIHKTEDCTSFETRQHIF